MEVEETEPNYSEDSKTGLQLLQAINEMQQESAIAVSQGNDQLTTEVVVDSEISIEDDITLPNPIDVQMIPEDDGHEVIPSADDIVSVTQYPADMLIVPSEVHDNPSENLVYQLIVSDEIKQSPSDEVIDTMATEVSDVVFAGDQMCEESDGNSMNVVYSVAEGRKVVTVPITLIDGQVQQVPVEVPEWAELSDHNLIAVAEDGTTVPLTIIQESQIETEIPIAVFPDVQPQSLPKPKPPVPKSLKDVMAMTSGPKKKQQPSPKQSTYLSSSENKTPIKLNRRVEVTSQANVTTNQIKTLATSKVAIKARKERENGKIELRNTTQSTISTENMQTLIQILQSLPSNSRNQTVRIILQNETGDGEEAVTTTHTIVSQQEKTKSAEKSLSSNNKRTQIQSITTSEIGCQVLPEYLLEAQNQPAEQEAEPPPQPNEGAETLSVSVAENATEKNVEADEDDKIVTKKGQRKAKPRPSKVITLEQQWVVNPQPGVSYYAVVDYLSEHEHDGYASGSELRRPQALFSAFMEDHVELQDAVDDVKNTSVLESTLDSSLFLSPYRKAKHRLEAGAKAPNNIGDSIDLPESAVTSKSVTMSDYDCEIESDTQMPLDSADQMSLCRSSASTRSARIRAPRVHYQHCCGYCSYGSREKLLVVEHCILEHPNQPVKTLSLLKGGITSGRVCPYCRQTFESHEFFSHMRFAHNEVHPYKCGYCDFMGRDRNQIRHHIQKKHKLPIKIINLKTADKLGDGDDIGCDGLVEGKRRIMGSAKSGAISEGDDSVYEYMTDEDEDEADDGDNQKPMHCPECRKPFKTLKYLKTHIKVHQALRYQCGYCDFTTVMLHQVIRHCQSRHADCEPKVLTKELEPEKNPIVSKDIDSVLRQVHAFNTRLPRDPDGSKWMRKWCCPHCDYTCQFGASYRRHLRMHANVLPYKCNYCSFKGREKYYVRRHINRMHKGVPMIVIENTPENCQMDSSSDEGYQEKGLRRKRRRKMKRLKPVVPVNVFDTNVHSDKYQKLPVGERGMRKPRAADGGTQTGAAQSQRKHSEDVVTSRQATSSAGSLYPRLPRAKEWSGENISDYIQAREGDKIICKVCGQKTLSKAFYKHARKHFRVKPFKCGYCNYMSVERAKIRVHNTLKHPNAPFRIEECHLASILPKEFMDLIGDSEASSSANAADIVFGEQQVQQPLNQQELIQVPLLETPQLRCPLCEQMIDYDEPVLREHLYVHYDYYPFICSSCNYKANSSDKIVDHGNDEHPGEEIVVYEVDGDKPEGLEETILQFLAEGEAVMQQRLLEIIEQTTNVNERKDDKNEEQELFHCPICNKMMNLHTSTIRRHLYSHYQYKPFKCGYCDFQAVSKANIKQHTVTHGSISPVIEVLKDLPMPDNLVKTLKQLQQSLKITLIDVKPDEEKVDPLSDAVDDCIKVKIDNGECPVCSISCDHNDIQGHLLYHLSTYQQNVICGHCRQDFATYEDAKIHHDESHKAEDILISPTESTLAEENVQLCRNALQYIRDRCEQSKDIEYQVVILADDKEMVIPVTKLDSRDDSNGQGYALVLEQGEDGTVKAAKMIKDSSDDIPKQNLDHAENNLSEPDQPSTQQRVKVEEMDESGDDSEDDEDIVTVGGVLLTRSYRSEAENDDESPVDEEENSGGEDCGGALSTSSLLPEMNQFECDICDVLFTKRIDMEKHISEFHGIKVKRQRVYRLPSTSQPKEVVDEEDEEETVENITKMIHESENEAESSQKLICGKRKASDDTVKRKQRRTETNVNDKSLVKLEKCVESTPNILRILQLKVNKKNNDAKN